MTHLTPDEESLKRLAESAKDLIFQDEFGRQTVTGPVRILGLLATIAELRGAIRWALGEGDDFRPREEGEGAYWWRKELRRRAALSGTKEDR